MTFCHYLYFLDKGFQRFQSYLYNECHDVLIISINFIDVAVLNIDDADYCCIINGISKTSAKNLLQHADLTEKKEVLQNKENKSIKAFNLIYECRILLS